MKKRFSLVLIKPSHYDDDGYVIQWFRSAIPSNSLAALYGLSLECAQQSVLGADVDIDIHAFDETNTVIHISDIAALIESADDGMVMLVGVQSNQFPRALDLARPLRERGIKVGIGGFHVSGTMAMLKERDPYVQKALDIGVSLFAGEAEGRLGQVLIDAHNNELQPVYNFMDDLPNIEGVASPLLPAERVHLTAGATTSFDAGRGCPFACSFCTIINVQGRKSRRRSPADIETIVRANVAQGLHSFFITDDNFARNKDWEIILDKLIELREVEKLKISFIIQVDTLCHKLPNFIEKAKRAGIKRVFIGLENINPDSLLGAKKRQNKITDYRQMLLAWKHAGIVTYCGYILGFPGDTPESIISDIEIIKRELPVDMLEFFYLTPLPGSEDHKRLHEAGIAMDEDLNKYDLNHDVTDHAIMSRTELRDTYRKAWETYYTDEHVETVLRRCIATGTSPGKTMFFIVWFKGCIHIEGIHPLEGGFLRIKSRKNRRSGLGIESPLTFYPKYLAGTLRRQFRWISLYIRIRLIYMRVRKDPDRLTYMDTALEPVTDHEEDREMFQSESAKSYLDKVHRIERVSRGETV
ncbi:MAG TPA: radical SAM protein [Pyrinomonadaceae bacterium]|nr:radical SAM protein [Chloracidobacterium sp.]MBP9108012.1 radical SAM protein [Pyrinomonadaceae bacterium]MBK7801964.1 radical SAM protein [Chloracidobacterium sp.]MBK9437893.1 radical SAM protein [Chloracidobacterium sp.]MBK9765682.1 radical SAM protein [Chloracidobacterium sp.]